MATVHNNAGQSHERWLLIQALKREQETVADINRKFPVKLNSDRKWTGPGGLDKGRRWSAWQLGM